jgi:hypothetical protein
LFCLPEYTGESDLNFFNKEEILKYMDSGQTMFIICQLAFGAVATFLAIMLWSKTREVAWMLVIIGAIFAYVEIIYSILGVFGLSDGDYFMVGSVPVISILLPLLRMIFFIAAFTVMIVKQTKN